MQLSDRELDKHAQDPSFNFQDSMAGGWNRI